MKLLKKLGLVSMALLLGVGLASCHKNEEPEDPTPVDPTPVVDSIKINEILTKNNSDKVKTTGVVFAKTTDGIYINDGTASVFVVGGLTANVKDEVSVEGNLAIVNKMPEIKTATVTVVGNNKQELQPVAKTVAEVAALDETVRTNYGQYFTVTATLTKNAFGVYSLEKDGKTLLINEKSSTAALAEWELKDVVIDVVTTSKSGEGWTVSYCKTATDIKEVPVDLDAVKEQIFTYAEGKLPAAIYGSLSLPKEYADIPNIELIWSVKEAGTIAIVDNVATVTLPETDTDVTLVLTLKAGELTASKDFVVTNKAIREVEIADLATTGYASKENVIIKGKVVLTSRSNGSIFSNIIVDAAGQHFARVDSDETECVKYNVGDEIKALGAYSVNNGIQRFKAINIEVTKASTSTVVDWTTLASTPLVTEQDYINLADGMDSDAGIPLTLYKVVNPYITTSASTGYNYLRFGPTPSTAKSGVIAADKGQNTASMSLLAMNFILGNNNAYKELFEIGNYNETAIKNVGLTMYVFCGYNLESKTTAQFVFAKEAIVSNLKEGIDAEIDTFATTINASEAGVFALPKKIADVDITWTTNCPYYNVETGAYTEASSPETFKFTATYHIGTAEYIKEIEIAFDCAQLTYLSVSDFNTKDVGAKYNVEGEIIGFATANPDQNDKIVLYGMYISDGAEIAYISHSGLTYDETIANGYEAIYYYGAEKTAYKIGDFIQIQKASKNSAGISITTESVVKVNDGTHDKITFAPTKFETVSSQEDFKNVLALGQHNLFKVVATEDNPICFGSSKASDQTICLTNKIRIYFAEVGSGAGTTGIKPDGTHTVATKTIASELNLGTAWWKNLGADSFDLTTNSTSIATKFVGSFYAVLTITSGSFYQITLLPCNFSLTVKA